MGAADGPAVSPGVMHASNHTHRSIPEGRRILQLLAELQNFYICRISGTGREDIDLAIYFYFSSE